MATIHSMEDEEEEGESTSLLPCLFCVAQARVQGHERVRRSLAEISRLLHIPFIENRTDLEGRNTRSTDFEQACFLANRESKASSAS